MQNRLVIDRRRGQWLGVCQGLAEYSGAPVLAVRLGVVFLTLMGLGLPGIVAYVLIGWLAGAR